jgi:predicted porin
MSNQLIQRKTMKQIAALALLAAVSATASAQSSVTLFGVVDVGARYTKNGDDSVTSLSTNGLATSRIGFKGVEDLGDGLKAGFWLEGGLNPDTGSSANSSKFFDRRATVSLTSASLGEVRLGRDNNPFYTTYSAYDVFGANGVGGADKFTLRVSGVTVNTLKRDDNQASYFLPTGLGGVYGQVTAAAGEGSLGTRLYGGRLGFTSGPFDISGAYSETQVAAVAATGFDDKYQTYILGASYDFGFLKLLGYYSESKVGDLKQDIGNVGVSVPVGPGALRATYVNVNGKGGSTDANDATQWAVGYVYDLSKRTALYATAAHVNNKGGSVFAIGGPYSSTNPANPAIAAGDNSSGYEIGIRHTF